LANKWQKGLGGAGYGAQIGAGVGTIVPGIGTLVGGGIGAGVGFLGGLLGGDDEELQSPMFSDINLARDNPELWARIQQNDFQIQAAQRALNSRRAGMTAQEQYGLNDAQSNLGAQQSWRGTLGSSTGVAQQADLEGRLRAQIAERAYKEQLGLMANVQGLHQQQFQDTRAGLQDVMGAMRGQNQNAQAEQTAGNQFWSGGFNSGMNAIGNMQNQNALESIYGNNPYASYNPLASMQTPQAPAYQPQYTLGVNTRLY